MNTFKYLLAALLAITALHARADEEQDLIAILKSNATATQKSDACRGLRLVGTMKSVEAILPLLSDPKVSEAARYALEGMPFPAIGELLLKQLDKSSGPMRLALIDSLGWRGTGAAVPQLAALLSDSDPTTASAAATALGRLGGANAIPALNTAREEVPASVRPAVNEALLRCAEQQRAAGETAKAEAIYTSLFGPREEDHIRVAAYSGLIRCANDGGVARIKSALEGSDGAAVTAALREYRGLRPEVRGQRSEVSQQASDVKGQEAAELTKAFAGLLPKADPGLKVALLAALRVSGDVTALPAVLEAARSSDPAVETAAVTALGELGDPTAVPLLAEMANASDAGVQGAARTALVSLRRGNIAGALIKQLSTATPAVQLEVVRALSARSDETAMPELLRLARTERPETRKAALSALSNLAEGSDAAALVQLLADSRQDDVRAGVRIVFERLAERTGEKPKWDSSPIAKPLTGSDPELRKALFPVAALFIDDRLRAAMQTGLKDPDASIRAAATRAACDARDPALVPDLLEIARQTSEDSLRSLALERVVRLTTGEGTTVTPAQRTETLSTAMALAARPEDKRMVLSGLSQVPNSVALALAEKTCADPQVKTEAEVACLQIAQKLPNADFAAAEASLTRLAGSAATPSVRTNAQAVLKRMNSGWLYAGPYRQQGKQATDLFNIPFPPEQPGASDVRWQRAPGSADLRRSGEVDLDSVVGGNHCVVYLKTRIYSPSAQPVIFAIGSDDGIKLWVNGELVHANNAVRGLTPDQDRAKGRLREGWNDVLAKITQHTLGCGMTLRIKQENGTEIAGLRQAP